MHTFHSSKNIATNEISNDKWKKSIQFKFVLIIVVFVSIFFLSFVKKKNEKIVGGGGNCPSCPPGCYGPVKVYKIINSR